MSRILALLYGLVSYLAFLAVFLYFIAFVGDLWVPKTVDAGGGELPLALAVLVDVGLIALFGLQHSGMARPAFKRWWSRFMPASVRRSTYVLVASLTLAFVCWAWQPIPGTLWQVEAPAGRAVLWGVFALGWALVLAATFLINHFHLFGLQQVWERFRGRQLSSPKFQTPGLYRLVRHPLNLGFLLAFWAIPEMSWGHALFALAFTGHILVSIPLEERDLIATFGERYRRYRERVPTLFPRPAGDGGAVEGEESA